MAFDDPTPLTRRHRGITPSVRTDIPHCGCCKAPVIVNGLDISWSCHCHKRNERGLLCGRCEQHCACGGKDRFYDSFGVRNASYLR